MCNGRSLHMALLSKRKNLGSVLKKRVLLGLAAVNILEEYRGNKNIQRRESTFGYVRIMPITTKKCTLVLVAHAARLHFFIQPIYKLWAFPSSSRHRKMHPYKLSNSQIQNSGTICNHFYVFFGFIHEKVMSNLVEQRTR